MICGIGVEKFNKVVTRIKETPFIYGASKGKCQAMTYSTN